MARFVSGRTFSLFLDTTGWGTGTTAATGDYSSAAQEFRIYAPPDMTLELHRVIVSARDTAINADDYGAIASGLTNGITVQLKNDDGVILDLTNGDPIKNTADWAKFCYDVSALTWGAGNEFFVVRWTFSRAGKPLIVRGDRVNSVAPDGERLAVICNDNLGGLVDHTFCVQGYAR